MRGKICSYRFVLTVGIIIGWLIINFMVTPGHGYGRRRSRTWNGTHWIRRKTKEIPTGESDERLTPIPSTKLPGRTGIYFIIKSGPGWHRIWNGTTHTPARAITTAQTTKLHKSTRTRTTTMRIKSRSPKTRASTTSKPTTSITSRMPTSTVARPTPLPVFTSPKTRSWTTSKPITSITTPTKAMPTTGPVFTSTKPMISTSTRTTTSTYVTKPNNDADSEKGTEAYFGVKPPRFQIGAGTPKAKPITTPDPPLDNRSTDKSCPIYKNDICGCREAQCEFNSVKRECVSKSKNDVCAHSSYNCSRPSTLFSIGGVICEVPSKTKQDNCKISKVIVALNLKDSKRFTDARGIQFAVNRGNIRTMGSSSRLSNIIGFLPSHAVESFMVIMRDNPGKPDFKNASARRKPRTLFKGFQPPQRGGDRCVVYVIHLALEGKYELGFNMSSLTPVGRPVTILFNNHLIVEEFDASKYLSPSESMEFSIGFELTGKVTGSSKSKTKFRMKGFPKSYIRDGETTLGFCNGVCGQQNDLGGHGPGKIFSPTSVINTISVVKLKID